jgi:hypothetical protein
LREFFEMLLDQVRKFPDHLAARGRRNFRPRPGFESGPRCLHSPVDVLAIALRNVSQHFARGGVIARKRFSRGGVHPFAVNQEFLLSSYEARNI